MKFAIITHVNHIKSDEYYYGYAPYVREMNIWLKFVNQVIVVGPAIEGKPTAIDIPYQNQDITFVKVPNFSFTSAKNNLISIFKLPLIFWKIFWVMKTADHIHLRCPGNMGLVASFVQILFPKKIKTVKYAGNWDPESKQPWTYKLQQFILKNTFLTRNITVLVYGDWQNETKNIKSFFTATYAEAEKEVVEKESLNGVIEFVFMGSLVPGKNPLYAVKLVEQLAKNGKNVILNLYGEGIQRTILENYIKKFQLEKVVFLQGNQNQETIKKAYKKSHFVILPSKSEGWPKAIAEGMFWGCVPIATKVSCLPFMLDYGNRGVFLEMSLEKDVPQLMQIIGDEVNFKVKSKLAANWSQNYTTNVFESEIKKLLQK